MSARSELGISACLLGCNCRYNAVVKRNSELAGAGGGFVPVCPEELGGLPTPRPAADIEGGDGADVLDGRARVIDEHGADVTAEFVAGARRALERLQAAGIAGVILKSRSPSCGFGTLSRMDGSVASGNGVFAELLRRQGIAVESAEFDAEV